MNAEILEGTIPKSRERNVIEEKIKKEIQSGRDTKGSLLLLDELSSLPLPMSTIELILYYIITDKVVIHHISTYLPMRTGFGKSTQGALFSKEKDVEMYWISNTIPNTSLTYLPSYSDLSFLCRGSTPDPLLYCDLDQYYLFQGPLGWYRISNRKIVRPHGREETRITIYVEKSLIDIFYHTMPEEEVRKIGIELDGDKNCRLIQGHRPHCPSRYQSPPTDKEIEKRERSPIVEPVPEELYRFRMTLC